MYSLIPRNKLHCRWTGPYRVVDTVNYSIYVVEQIVTCKRKEVHGQRMSLYSDQAAHDTYSFYVWDLAAHDTYSFYVDNIIGVRLVDDGYQLKIRWKGFQVEEATWEPLADMYLSKATKNQPAGT